MPDPAPDSATIETRMRVLLGPQAGRETYHASTITKNSTITVGAGLAVYPGDLVIFEIRVNAGMTMEKAHLFYQQRFRTFE